MAFCRILQIYIADNTVTITRLKKLWGVFLCWTSFWDWFFWEGQFFMKFCTNNLAITLIATKYKKDGLLGIFLYILKYFET